MKFKNTSTGEIVNFTEDEIIEEINRDRSEEWTDYAPDDWQDGLTFTEYELYAE